MKFYYIATSVFFFIFEGHQKMTSKTSSVTLPVSTTASITSSIRYHGKDSNGESYGISADFHFVKSRDAKKYPQCDKNGRICLDEKFAEQNNQIACSAGNFALVMENIDCEHKSIPKQDLRLKVHGLMVPDGKIGRSWLMKNGSRDAFDTNPGDGDDVGTNVQFTIDHAIKYGQELTDEQIASHVEKTTEKTGLFTIVTSLCYVEPTLVTKGCRGGGEPTRSLTRGSTMRGGNLRGGSDDDFLKGYSLGRVGGGSEAFTNVKIVDTIDIENTDFKTIVRMYVDDTTTTDIPVKYMQSREELNASTVLPPFRGN